MNLIIEVLQNTIQIALLVLVPWIMLISVMKKTKSKNQKRILVIAFLLYVGISIVTKNILPTIITFIYLSVIYKSNKHEKEKYYLRPLKSKKYKLSILKSTYTITVANERIKVISMSLVFKILVTAFALWFMVFLNAYGIEASEQEITKEFLTSSTLKAIYLGILIVITGPILEEFIFRHVMYRVFKKSIGKYVSAIVTSILFTVLHYNIAGVPVFFSMGLFNCFLYEKYGFRAAVINHVIFNSITLLWLILIQ
ncbi:MAG: CPBP family intramembrane glutamic endopeptidase [Clostridium sp.]|uniref:CPBP family intramembrane glutamic endopeptidase n=1 Tax=Clostridium sp. TaxID=1506 RepID=UPI002FCBD084